MKRRHDISRRRFLGLLGATTACLAWPAGCGRSRWQAGRSLGACPAKHVIFISLDTLRADHLGCLGNRWIRTPQIDALADQSVNFTDYMTVVPSTLASHTSLFTGKYPHTHGVPRNGFVVNEENVMLTGILRDVGFRTAGFLGSFALDSRFGFDRGFEHYDETFDVQVGQHGADQNQRSAGAVTDAAVAYLDRNDVPDHLFLFLHYFDPHAPYLPHAEFLPPYAANAEHLAWIRSVERPRQPFTDDDLLRAQLYAGEVSYLDHHVGRLLAYLDRKGLLDDSLLVVTSDHGENFKDHPVEWGHGHTLYQSCMRGVCLVRLPGGDKGGTQVPGLVASIDVLPTVLGYLGLQSPPAIDGEAVILTEPGIDAGARVRFGEATNPWEKVETDPRWTNMRKSRCIRDGRTKYIHTPHTDTEELYDLATDPDETTDLLRGADPATQAAARALRERLQAWAESAHPLPSRFDSSQQDETLRRLRSLGYLR